MAKRKRLRVPHNADSALVNNGRKQKHSWQASTIVHPSFPPSPPRRRVASAHAKSLERELIRTSPQQPHPTLGDRFHNLPAELRAHVFALLLVRPVKWDLLHKPSCSKLEHNGNIRPQPDWTNYRCAHCVTWHHPWAAHHEPGWVHPWRSKWAPQVENPFLCSECWDKRFRPRPFPRSTGDRDNDEPLPCLCARREDLDVLLVCRRWYEEAGRIFYARNVFTFENGATVIDFIGSLDTRWRNTLTRMSIMAHLVDTSPANPCPQERQSGFESGKKLAAVWSALRLLPSLSYLELDALFLTRADTVHALLRLGLRNLRRVSFTLRNHPWQPSTKGCKYVFHRFAAPSLLVGGFAEEVARAIKGQRRGWLKRAGAMGEMVEREREVQKSLRSTGGVAGVVCELNCDDVEVWTGIFWRGGGYQHAFLPWRWSAREQGIWRERNFGPLGWDWDGREMAAT